MAGIGVLVASFPKLSETFIAQELKLLEERGFRVEIYPRRPSGESQVQPVARTIAAPVFYLPRLPGGLLAFAAGNGRALVRQPLRYLLTLSRAARRSVRLRDGALARFFEAGWLVGSRRIGAGGVSQLHAHFFNKPSQIAEQAARLAGVRFTISAHAVDIYTQDPALIRSLAGAAEAVLTCTRYNARYLLEEVGLDPSKVHVVYHGIDTERFEAREAPALGDSDEFGGPRFVSVGRLVPKKGLDDCLHALARLLPDAFRFDVYGDGPQRAELEALRAELGLEERVHFHGAVTQDELIPALRRGGIYLCGSRETVDGNRDGIPNTLAEAMAIALPVVATRVSGIPELVEDEVTGLLVKSRDPDALAGALERLLRNPDEAERFGRAGRRRVEEMFDCRSCFEDCARVLERLS
jgi:glycosyltransferase involved in cell wall biosynthesis